MYMLAMAVTAMAWQSCDYIPQQKQLTGPNTEIKIALQPFSKLDVSNMFQIEYIISDTPYAMVVAPQSVIDCILFTNKGQTLEIEMKQKNVNYKFDDHNTIVIKLYGPILNEIELSGMVSLQYPSTSIATMKVDVSGMSNLQISSIQGDDITFDISGASKLRIDSIGSRKLSMDISGISNVDVMKGYVYVQDLDISGTAKYDARGLMNKWAKVDISGIGNASIQVDSFMTADVSGTANLNYKGNPTVQSNVSGMAKLNVIQ